MFSIPLVKGQTYDYARSAMAHFLQRHYERQPFEGIIEIEDYNTKYLEVVLTSCEDEQTTSNSNRVLFLKASRLVSEYENGIRFSDNPPILIDENSRPKSSKSTVYSTSGITGKLSLLTTFSYKNKLVYIYIKKRQ